MRYCIKFDKNNRYLDQTDEILIEYHYKKTELKLKPFLDGHPNQTIILEIYREEIEPDFIQFINKFIDYTNFKLKIHTTAFIETIKNEIEIPFFFDIFAKTYEDLYRAGQCGASEVYLDSSLCFSLRNCRHIADRLNIKMRAYPFLPLVYNGKYHKSYWQYFIRPEDVDLYGRYIDTLELIGPVSYANVMYQSYQEKKWNGKLNEIFPYLTDDYDNRYIIKDWSVKRVNCDRKCMIDERCTMCQEVYDLAISLEKLGVIIPAEVRYNNGEVLVPLSITEEKKSKTIKPNF